MQKKMGDFVAKCRQNGLKITPQRMAVYRALLESKEHPSAEMIFRTVKEVFPSVSLDTVNRTLLTLDEIGVAFIVEGSGDSKRYDANLGDHQHFKCVKCKRIVDFHHKPFDNIKVPKSIGENFIVLRKTVYIEGICDLCAKKQN
ncbi:MAG: transcriptional repressor [Phycisphaerales bacterium]|nr:MAG: transcriptional repressor [Phycisphaerales bacterium]